MAQKPDDWRTVSLCRDCHALQHRIGEPAFWRRPYLNIEDLIQAFCNASPKAAEIRRVKQERERGA